MAYQQHLGEWDIPLSEPSCFSYIFLTIIQLVRVLDNNAL